MNAVSIRKTAPQCLLFLLGASLLAGGPALAQVPVDDNGNPVPAIDNDTSAAAPADDSGDHNLTAAELQTLVGPIALYPDELLAVVLPASAYPLQIVEAARFLERLKTDKNLKPDDSWDPTVTALLNYPDVLKLMNDDLNWTYKLGEAVVRQQPDVIAAVEAFRDRAYAAGNLKSDDRQTVTEKDGTIEIVPVEDDVIYVPYYEPERVVVYQTQPVYHYYSEPRPLYYYPYPYGYSFASGYFWGVTTAFTIGWRNDCLRVFHLSYPGHPFYGRHYYGNYYRRPSINVYNSWYVNHHVRQSPHHFQNGDFWRPARHSGATPGHDRWRMHYYADPRREHSVDGYSQSRQSQRNEHVQRIATDANPDAARRPVSRGGNSSSNSAIHFRARKEAGLAARSTGTRTHATGNSARSTRSTDKRSTDNDNRAIHFRPRERTTLRAAPGNTRASRERSAATVSRSNRTVVAPAARERALTPGFSSHSSHSTRREMTSPRTSIRSSSQQRTVAPSSRSVSRPQITTTRPATRATQRSVRPRLSAPHSVSRPGISRPSPAPGSATPRAAPRSTPRSTIQRAPSHDRVATPAVRRSAPATRPSERRTAKP